MKIVWVIEGPIPPTSAYSQQINLISQHLHDFGIESAICNPQSFEDQGDETLEAISSYNPDVIISFGNTHVWGLGEYFKKPVLSWFLWGTDEPLPIEGPIPYITFAAVSRYTQAALEGIGIDARCIPHAYDPAVFYPGRRKSARARLGWDDRDTVLMVGTNCVPDQEGDPDRKNWAGALEAFAFVSKSLPDIRLYAHTSNDGALDIMGYAEKLGIQEAVEVAGLDESDRSYPPEYIADLYRASDVLLFPSFAEGFGVPLIESQACGTPVITTDAGPMRELTQMGTAVRSISHPDRPGWSQPDTKELAKAIERWMEFRHSRKNDNSVMQEYAVEAVVEDCFLPILEELR